MTDSGIVLGVLTDQTGPFAPFGTTLTRGAQLYFDEINKAGGICGRLVGLEVRDHGSDVDRSVSAYTDLQPRVLGFAQLLGDGPVSALQTNITSDRVLTVVAGFSSSLLTNPYIAIVGASYDVETINMFDYLSRKHGLRSGEKVAHVYLDNEYGRNALLGSTFAARQLGVTLVPVRLAETDVDLTAEMKQLARSGVSAVIMTTYPHQTAAAVIAADGAGLTVPMMGNTPTYSAALLDTPAGPSLERRFRLSSSIAPFSADVPAVRHVADAYRAAYAGQPADGSVIGGYATAKVYGTVLDEACAKGDLSRQGLLNAFRGMSHIDTGGLVPTLDYSKEGASPAREVYINRPDRTQPGGLQVEEKLFASKVAGDYSAPGES